MLIQNVASQFGSFLAYQKVSVFFSDLTDAVGGQSQTITLGGVGGTTAANALSSVNSGNLVIPQGAWLVGVRMKVTALFTGGSMATLTASLGFLGGSATGILAAQDVLGATVGTVYAPTAVAITTINNTTLLPSFTPTVTFNPTTYALSALTAGQLDIEFLFTNVSTTTSSTGAITPGV